MGISPPPQCLSSPSALVYSAKRARSQLRSICKEDEPGKLLLDMILWKKKGWKRHFCLGRALVQFWVRTYANRGLRTLPPLPSLAPILWKAEENGEKRGPKLDSDVKYWISPDWTPIVDKIMTSLFCSNELMSRASVLSLLRHILVCDERAGLRQRRWIHCIEQSSESACMQL